MWYTLDVYEAVKYSYSYRSVVSEADIKGRDK